MEACLLLFSLNCAILRVLLGIRGSNSSSYRVSILSEVTSIMNKVVNSGQPAKTLTTEANTQNVWGLSQPTSTPQKVLITAADSGTVIKTQDGKIINLKNVARKQGMIFSNLIRWQKCCFNNIKSNPFFSDVMCSFCCVGFFSAITY